MGHTVWSQRIVADMMLDELGRYGKSLRADDKKAYERLLKRPLLHLASITYTSSIHAWAFLILSAMLEQEKRLMLLEEEMQSRKEIELLNA